MDDQINEGLCNILHRLWTFSSGVELGLDNTVDNLKPYTADGVPVRKLFIGNLAQKTTHKDLEKLFSNYGKIDCCYLKRNTDKNNYAFVTFSNMDDALKATKDGHRKNIHLHNRDLRVMPADSWHQPDSIENLNKKVQKTSDPNKQISTEYILNDDALIHKLNDDCLMHIFTYLSVADRVRMERVCRRWQNISQESWRTFKKLDLAQSTWGFDILSSSPREIDTPTLRKVLLRCGQFLTHIDFSMFAEKLSKSTLTVVGKFCPNLQNIDVTALNVSPAGIKALAANCNNITDFNLGHSSSACDNDLCQLFSKNKKLKHLKIEQNSITGKCLLSLPTDSIESISLCECTNVSPCHFSNAIKSFTNLHDLSLEKCVSLNDQVVKAISSYSKSLKVLRLKDYFPMISIAAMPHIAELVNLEELDVSLNFSVHDAFLVVVGAQCKQLKKVEISSCHSVTNTGLAAITSLPALEFLNISYLKVTDEVLSDMPKLKTMLCRGCPNLNNQGLSTLVEESPGIELLDLSGCNQVSNDLIEVAIRATKNRNNGVILKMFVGGTAVDINEIDEVSPFLQVLRIDLSESYLRPDFDHDQNDFFAEEFLDLDEFDDIDENEYGLNSDDLDTDDDTDNLYFDYMGRLDGSDDELYLM